MHYKGSEHIVFPSPFLFFSLGSKGLGKSVSAGMCKWRENSSIPLGFSSREHHVEKPLHKVYSILYISMSLLYLGGYKGL